MYKDKNEIIQPKYKLIDQKLDKIKTNNYMHVSANFLQLYIFCLNDSQLKVPQ